MSAPDRGRLGAAAVRALALVLFPAFLLATLAVAGDTLGYDFLAYHAAARRVLDGQPPYDMSFAVSGGFGLFYYPPAFLPLILPFGLLDASVATWVWIGLLVASFLVGVAVMPVARQVRWWILLLAGVSFPFVYGVKLGQVAPLLFLAFAIGWRALDRPVPLGLTMAVGTAIKLQPGLLFVWAALTRRWTAVVVGVVALAVLSLIATVLAGFGSWFDFLELVQRVSDPITTEHNFTPGAVAYQLGVSAGAAAILQVLVTLGVLGVTGVAALRARADASYLATIVASQLVSPILWDHYALLLLLPVAWLLERGHRWAIVVPLATSVPLVGVTPAITYPLAFVVTLLATIAVGWRGGRPVDEPAERAPASGPAVHA